MSPECLERFKKNSLSNHSIDKHDALDFRQNVRSQIRKLDNLETSHYLSSECKPKVEMKWIYFAPTIISIAKLLCCNSRIFSKQHETNSIKSKFYFSESAKNECNEARDIRFTNISASKKHRKTDDRKGSSSNIYMLLSLYYVLFKNQQFYPLKLFYLNLPFPG